MPQLSNKVEETLPENILQQYKLIGKEQAYKQIHFPENAHLLKQAEYRLKFEELFYIQLRLLKSKHFRKQSMQSFIFEKLGHYFNTFFNEHLPFELTNAQKRVIKEIRNDVRTGKQKTIFEKRPKGFAKLLYRLCVCSWHWIITFRHV